MEQKTDESAQSASIAPAGEKSAKEAFKSYFSATRIAYMAIFTAFSFALRFLELPLLSGTPVSFLKLDFSNIFPLIGGYALGPVAGVAIGVLKEALWIFYSTTAGVGELANILIMLPFVLIPSVAYKYRKGIKSVLIFLSVGCIAQVIWSFPVNWLLNFPIFSGFNWPLGMSLFMDINVWPWVILFNFIKSVVLGVMVFLMYKPISALIKMTNARFGRKKA